MILHRIKTKIKKHLISYCLKGNNVKCPICNKQFVTFLPFGVQMRSNASCPNCGSLERMRLYWLFFTQKGLLNNTKIKLLHVAPEKSLFNEIKKIKEIEYYPVDKFEKGYSYPKETIYMDITNIEFPDNYFNFILCSHVLEHIKNDKKALSELLRVLNPKGQAMIQVPINMNLEKTFEDLTITDPKERERVFGQEDHVRLYGKDFKEILEEVGFKVLIDKFAFNLTKKELFTYGIIPEDLYIVKK